MVGPTYPPVDLELRSSSSTPNCIVTGNISVSLTPSLSGTEYVHYNAPDLSLGTDGQWCNVRIGEYDSVILVVVFSIGVTIEVCRDKIRSVLFHEMSIT